VCAYVVTEGGVDVGVEELREFLDAQKVTKYMFPERVIRLDEMPMTPTGKIRKATLQQDVVERVKSEEAS